MTTVEPARPDPEPPRRRRKRCRRAIVAAMSVLLLSVLAAPWWGPPVLQRFALSFRVNDPVKSDAICILLGRFHVRPLRAAELYLRGYAPVVLIADYPQDIFYGSMESQLARIMTIRAGVPEDRLIRVHGLVTSTQEEARFYRDYAEKHGLKSLIVVTSAFHTRRSRWIFERVFAGSGIRLSYAAAYDPNINEKNWYKTDEGLVEYFSEALKTVYYYLRY